MSPLALPSFEIQGFRAFEYLNIERLGRVNLFVGKNNVGKTSLLEALWVYANQGSPGVLWSLLVDRNESESISPARIGDRWSEDELEKQFTTIRYLFYGRKETPQNQVISLGPKQNRKNALSIEYTTMKENGISNQASLFEDDAGIEMPAIVIRFGGNTNQIRLDRFFTRRLREPFGTIPENKNIFVPANGLLSSDVGRFWDNITLGAAESDVLESLRLLDARIERVNLIGSARDSRERIPIVKISEFGQPMPLRSLGEGMNRMFGLALAMVNAKGGMLLVDEIESGLHYSVLPKMWDFIFESAKRLDVQVFTTTHSWDCIDGFQKAATKSEDDGILIRLENKKGKIIPTIFQEKELAIATREQIEVR